MAKAEAEIFERWKVLRSELPNLPKSPFSGDMNGHSDSVSTADDDQMLSASLSMTPTQLSFASETDGSTLSASGSHSRSQSASRQKEEKSEVKSSPLASQEVKRNGSNATLVPHLLSAVNESRLKDSAGVQPVIQQEIPKNLLSRTSPPKPASMGNSMSFLRSTSFLRNSSVEKKEEKPNGKKIPISTSAGKLQLNNNNLTSPVVTTEGIQQMLPFKLAQEGNKKK